MEEILKKFKGINPLRESQYKTLKNINCEDLARKVNEITVFLSQESEIKKLGERIEYLGNVVEYLRDRTFKEPTSQKEMPRLGCNCEGCEEFFTKSPQKTDWGLNWRKAFKESFVADNIPDCIPSKNWEEMEGEVFSFISRRLYEKEKETREEIGREFKKWFKSGKNEMIEDAIERITGIKI